MRSLIVLILILGAFYWAGIGGATTENHNVRKGATALTWLTNPKHKSTPRARRLALGQLYGSLKQIGWLGSALCIHHYEGAWNDPYSPYYGGMQMDLEFQTTYGLVYYKRWGTADHWPKWAQLYTSYKAWLSRGWWPWPNTARYCGLL